MKIYTKKSCVFRPVRRSKAGFTLLELMVAAGIIIVAITGTLATFISASYLSQANRNKSVAASDANSVLENLKSKAYDALDSDTIISFNNLPNESIAVTVTKLINEKNVVANVTWTENQRQRSFTLATKVSF